MNSLLEEDDKSSNVRVALRIRPQSNREKAEMCRECINIVNGTSQIVFGNNRAFTYDYVFGSETEQGLLFSKCIHPLMDSCLQGYNATLLAYGQTGSGKTFTMGTGFDVSLPDELRGAIPRSIDYLFHRISDMKNECTASDVMAGNFSISVSFLELYNDEIIDLLDSGVNSRDSQGRSLSNVAIREDPRGGIQIVGSKLVKVVSSTELMDCLKKGSLARTTASTMMNAMSSRSHAIFTVYIDQQRPSKEYDPTSSIENCYNKHMSRVELLSSKFHFVDLAGSERLKRTHAVGDRAKESIAINVGLLALGNVISALGDESRRGGHVPYRDSKLTRLLQDSLGGNSRTIMVACISPSDCDFMETLNTLKYANRARNIQNKAIVNQDRHTIELATLRKQLHDLRLQLISIKSGHANEYEEKVLTTDNDVELNRQLLLNLTAENQKLKLNLQREKSQHRTAQDKIRILEAKLFLTEPNHQSYAGLGEEGVKDLTAPIRTDADAGNSAIKVMVPERRLPEKEAWPVGDLSLSCTNTCHTKVLHRKRDYLWDISKIPVDNVDVAMWDEAGYDSGLKPPKYKNIQILSREICPTDEYFCQQIDVKGNAEYWRAIKANNDVTAIPGWRRRRGSRLTSKLQPRQWTDFVEVIDNMTNTSFEYINGGQEETAGIVGDDLSDNDVDSDIMNNDVADIDGVECNNDDHEKDFEAEQSEYESSLVDLTAEISAKEDLVAQLELTQRQLKLMRENYEAKLRSLSDIILQTQEERDEVLHNMALLENTSEEEKAKIEKRFGDRLTNLTSQLKDLKGEKDAHTRLIKNNKRNEVTINKLQLELEVMKNHKVGILSKIKEDGKKQAELQKESRQTITQLQKQGQKFAIKIKHLESKNQQQQMLLKRRMEEVANAHKKLRQLDSRQVAAAEQRATTTRALPVQPQRMSTVPTSGPRHRINAYGDSMNGNERQRRVSSTILASVEFKKTKLEQEAKRLVQRRRMASHMQKLLSKREQLVREQLTISERIESISSDDIARVELVDSLGELESELEFHNETIDNTQREILEMEQGGEEDAKTTIQRTTASESRLLLEHFFKINVKLRLAEQEKFARFEAMEQQFQEMENMLHGVLDVPSHPSTVLEPSSAFSPNLHVSVERRDAFLPSASEEKGSDLVNEALAQDMYCNNPSLVGDVDASENYKKYECSVLTDNHEEKRHFENCSDLSSRVVTSIPELFKTLSDVSPVESAPEYIRSASSMPTLPLLPQDTGNVRVSWSPSFDTAASSSDVFSRLTQSIPADLGGDGSVPDVVDSRFAPVKSGNSRESALACKYIVYGHTGHVLALAASGSTLCSASQDGTVKLWDIGAGREVGCLSGHVGIVRALTLYNSDLLFSVSGPNVYVWDRRSQKCVRVLEPRSIVSSDVFAMAIRSDGQTLFTASDYLLRSWDLRTFSCLKPLATHKSSIFSLEWACIYNKNEVVITGSRDHRIRVFDATTLDLKQTLHPPHYDGVQSLAVVNDALFSGSRDKSIKKWNLNSGLSLEHSMNQAHGDWINSFVVLRQFNSNFSNSDGTCLISGSRDGIIKFWNPDTCSVVNEITAHRGASINAVAANEDNVVFTGSSDRTVRVWKAKSY